MGFLARSIMSKTNFEIILILEIWWLEIISVEKVRLPGPMNKA